MWQRLCQAEKLVNPKATASLVLKENQWVVEIRIRYSEHIVRKSSLNTLILTFSQKIH